MTKKRWYEEWEVTHNKEEAGVWTVDLPNSSAKMKKLTIKGKYNKGQVLWLISMLENALLTLSLKDKKIEKERGIKKD